MSINQLQILMIILLVGFTIPKKVIDYLTNMQFAIMSFEFMKFNQAPYLKQTVEYMTFELETSNLEYFEVHTGCTYVNNLSLLCIVVITMVAHLFMFMILRCVI